MKVTKILIVSVSNSRKGSERGGEWKKGKIAQREGKRRKEMETAETG